MPGARLTMRMTREILRLKFDQERSHREIAQTCCKSASTVGECINRFRASGLPWPLPEELDDVEIERRLYGRPEEPRPGKRPVPDWAAVHRELRRKGVTLALLHSEYEQTHEGHDPYHYAWFCQNYRRWAGRLDLVMRQDHKLGEKCFVDWAGMTVPVVDPATGEVWQASLFVAVLGASNFTFAEAFRDEKLPSWIAAHVRMFAYFQGTSELVVPDNPKPGVTKACYYEPDLNPTYQEWARHYDVVVLPARARRPRDKAKAESGVLVAERWILARLRNRTFFSLDELNGAIAELLEELNDRPFQKLPGSRRQVYEEQERPVLRPLPATPYVFARWKKAKVALDYHVELDGHYYSVPFTLVRQRVEIRYTARTVEVYHRRRRVASHARSPHRGGHTTCPEHMPPQHRRKAEWTPDRIRAWADRVGPSVRRMVEAMMERRRHPEQAIRSCFGLLKLSRRFGDERLDAACRRALQVRAYFYKSVKSILEKGLDRQPLPSSASTRSAGHHENVRGASYYATPVAEEGPHQLMLPFGDDDRKEEKN